MIEFGPDGPKLIMCVYAELSLLNLKLPNSYRVTVGWCVGATDECIRISANCVEIGKNKWLADDDSPSVMNIPRLAIVSCIRLDPGDMIYHHSDDTPKDDNGAPRTIN